MNPEDVVDDPVLASVRLVQVGEKPFGRFVGNVGNMRHGVSEEAEETDK